jgi:hypothetical protein
MSLDLVKKNSNSPFQLQRSIVDQGGSGGAYESGGFNPDMVYNNDAANAAVESLGKVIGAAISSRTAADNNASDVKTKERLDKKQARLSEKKSTLTGMEDVSKSVRLGNRIERSENKEAKVVKRINEYEKSQKLPITSTLTSSLNSINTKPAAAVTTKTHGTKKPFDFGNVLSNSQTADKLKNFRLR